MTLFAPKGKNRQLSKTGLSTTKVAVNPKYFSKYQRIGFGKKAPPLYYRVVGYCRLSSPLAVS